MVKVTDPCSPISEGVSVAGVSQSVGVNGNRRGERSESGMSIVSFRSLRRTGMYSLSRSTYQDVKEITKGIVQMPGRKGNTE